MLSSPGTHRHAEKRGERAASAMNRKLAIFLVALPLAAGIGLYATGTLERIDNALSLTLARYKWGGGAPKEGPAQPLESYAGWWQLEQVPGYGTEWIARVIVRAEGKRAWLRMWHACPPAYCEQGEFEAEVYGKPPHAVYALEVVRWKGKEVLWTVSLRPNGNNPNLLMILENRRAKYPQKNPYDNQSSATALKRVK